MLGAALRQRRLRPRGSQEGDRGSNLPKTRRPHSIMHSGTAHHRSLNSSKGTTSPWRSGLRLRRPHQGSIPIMHKDRRLHAGVTSRLEGRGKGATPRASTNVHAAQANDKARTQTSNVSPKPETKVVYPTRGTAAGFTVAGRTASAKLMRRRCPASLRRLLTS